MQYHHSQQEPVRRVYSQGQEDRADIEYNRQFGIGRGASQPCFTFQRTGDCKFGSNCHYAHIGAEGQHAIRRQHDNHGRGRGGYTNKRNESAGADGADFGNEGSEIRPPKQHKVRGGAIRQKLPFVHPQVAQVKQLLARVGDYTAQTEDEDMLANIDALAGAFIGRGDLQQFPDDISDVFLKCMSTLSVQSTIISSLLGAIFKGVLIRDEQDEAGVFKRDATFPSIVVRKIGDAFINALRQNNVNVAKVLLRSLVSLTCTGCLVEEGDGSLLRLLEIMLLKVESDVSAVANVSLIGTEGKVAMFLLASTIPWAISFLPRSATGLGFVQRVLPLLVRFDAEYKSVFDMGGPMAVFQANAVPVDDDGNEISMEARGAVTAGPQGSPCWDTLWTASHFAMECIQKASTGEFVPPACMLASFNAFRDVPNAELTGDDGTARTILALNDEIAVMLQQVFVEAPTTIFFGSFVSSTSTFSTASRTLSSQSSSGLSSWLSPQFVVFDAETCEQSAHLVASTSSFERHILAEYFRDIVYFFDPVVSEDGCRSGDIPLMCSHLAAVAKMRSKDDVAVSIDSLLVETLFHKIVQIPINPMQTSLFFRVIKELCKSPGFANELCWGTSSVFMMLSEMDSSPVRELASWFAMHQLNTQFQWPLYASWIETCMEDEADGARILFLKCFVDKLGRSVNHADLRANLPETFHTLLPGDSLPVCNMCVTPNFLALFKHLKNMVELRDDPEAISDWLERPDCGPAELTADETWRSPLLLEAIFMISGDVPSTFTSLVERYSDPLRLFSSSEIGELALMACLANSLGHEPGYFNQTLDILIRRGVVSVTAAAKWATSDENLRKLAVQSWPYKHIELIANRALDIAKAAVSRRKSIGEPMPFDERTDSMPISTFLIAVKSAAVSDATADTMEETLDDETQAVNDATEAVVEALRKVRQVYSVILGNLALGANSEEATAAWKTTAASLARHVCSSYSHAESMFLQVGGFPVVLTDKRSVAEALVLAKQRVDKVSRVEKVFNLFV